MKLSKLNIGIFILFMGFLVPTMGWAQRNKKNKAHIRPESSAPKSTEPVRKLTHAEQVELEYQFTDGLKFFLIEDYSEATKIFKKCIEIQPHNPVFHYKTSESLLQENHTDEALIYALAAQELDPKNTYYYEQLVKIYKRRDQYMIIAETLKELIANTEEQERHYFELAIAYLQQDKHQEAVKVYNEAEKKYGISEVIVRYKQKIYLSLDDMPSALKEGKKLIEAYPDVVEYYTNQAKLLITVGKTNEAEKLLKQASEIEPKNPRIRLVLSDLYQMQGKSDQQVEELKITFENPELAPARKVKVLRDYLTKSSNPSVAKLGLELTEVAITAHPEHADLQEIYGKFLALNGQKDKAILAFKHSLEINPNNYRVWDKLIQLQIHERNPQAIIETTENALDYFPNQATIWFYNGNAHLLNKNYSEAIDALEQSQMLAITDTDLQFQILAYLGASYHGNKDFDSSDEVFAQALELRPEDPSLLNNYSYYLATRGEKLDKAKEMCQKLLDINPDSPTYLDTYAWVLYAEEDYKSALKYLEQAVKLTNDGSILEHYGDVLYKTGNAEEALIQWKKAKTIGGNLTENIDKKIAEGKTLE